MAAEEDVETFLSELRLDRHIDKFKEECIQYHHLSDLTDENLRELGLNMGERKTLLKHCLIMKRPNIANLTKQSHYFSDGDIRTSTEQINLQRSNTIGRTKRRSEESGLFFVKYEGGENEDGEYLMKQEGGNKFRIFRSEADDGIVVPRQSFIITSMVRSDEDLLKEEGNITEPGSETERTSGTSVTEDDKQKMVNLFAKYAVVDPNPSILIKEEFETLLQDEVAIKYCASMNLHPNFNPNLYYIFDWDADGQVSFSDYKKFIYGTKPPKTFSSRAKKWINKRLERMFTINASEDFKHTPYVPERPLSIALVGSTGVGKSSFGNFLLKPFSGYQPESDIFKVGHHGLACTSKVQMEGDNLIRIIDTPGLNENPFADLHHMIEVRKTINKNARYLDAVVLVQKFGSKFDTQWVNTVKYYSGLFKGMFDENLIVVLTHFDFSERGKLERRMKHQNVPEIRKNVTQTIANLCKLRDANIPLFCINSVLTPNLHIYPEFPVVLSVRDLILKKIENFVPRNQCQMTLQKTHEIKILDERDIVRIRAEIDYEEKEISNTELSHKLKLINDLTLDLEHHDKTIAELDTNELVKAKSESFNEGGFLSMKCAFEVKSEIAIEQWIVENSYPSITSFEIPEDDETPKCLRGYFYTRGLTTFLSLALTTAIGFHFSVTGLTRKRIARKKSIDSLKRDVQRKQAEIKAHHEFCEEHKILLDRLIEKRRQIRHLQRWDFELEEAIERLEDLKKEGIVETIQNEEDGEDEGLYANQIEGEQNKTKMGENN